MRKEIFAVAVAALIAGCGPQTYAVNSAVQLNTTGSTLVNAGSGTSSLTLTFTALGAPAAQTVTVNQPPATGSTVYSAVTGTGCTGVATIAGSASATTSNGPTGSFVVTPTGVAASGVCTFIITSSTPGSQATITVNTSGA
jgi:precorrin-6B methylase 2